MAPLVSALAATGLAVLGISHATRTYLDYADSEETSRSVLATDGGSSAAESATPPVSPQVLDQERVRAYREIMASIITLNRRVVEMDATDLHEEADRLVHGKDSALDGPHGDVTETYQSNFHIISPAVRDAVSGYVDYLVTYHDDGAQAGELLSRSGAVSEAMRADLGLEPLFDQHAADGVSPPNGESTADGDDGA